MWRVAECCSKSTRSMNFKSTEGSRRSARREMRVCRSAPLHAAARRSLMDSPAAEACERSFSHTAQYGSRRPRRLRRNDASARTARHSVHCFVGPIGTGSMEGSRTFMSSSRRSPGGSAVPGFHCANASCMHHALRTGAAFHKRDAGERRHFALLQLKPFGSATTETRRDTLPPPCRRGVWGGRMAGWWAPRWL